MSENILQKNVCLSLLIILLTTSANAEIYDLREFINNTYQISDSKTNIPPEIQKLINAVVTRPWEGTSNPIRVALTNDVKLGIVNELSEYPAIKSSYMKLDANRRNTEWFEGIKELKEELQNESQETVSWQETAKKNRKELYSHQKLLEEAVEILAKLKPELPIVRQCQEDDDTMIQKFLDKAVSRNL